MFHGGSKCSTEGDKYSTEGLNIPRRVQIVESGSKYLTEGVNILRRV